MSFVTARNIFQSYDRRPILERVNVDVDEGEFISIVGASGCGKSTFLRLLLAQEVPTKGEIRVAGAPPAVEPGQDRGIVFQRYSVFPHMTVRDNLVAAEAFSASRTGWIWGAAKRASRARAEETLERIGLGHMGHAYPKALSGGMQQRLAIAQALMAKPRILLLDEPFGALDPGTRLSMHDFLQELRAETGMTVFMVTHDLEEGFKLGDRVLVFDKPRWDPHDPQAYGATITYDFDARNGGIPYQGSLQPMTEPIDQDEVDRIEQKLYEALVEGAPQIKVARMIADAIGTEDWPDHKNEVINAALAKLSQRPDVQSFGLLHRWRHSEVLRLPANGTKNQDPGEKR